LRGKSEVALAALTRTIAITARITVRPTRSFSQPMARASASRAFMTREPLRQREAATLPRLRLRG
jgi:hypothetical protein